VGEQFRFVSTDTVISQIERKLQSQGVTIGDIGTAIAAELGVSLDDWWAYGEVEHAAHRYQMRQFDAYLRQQHPKGIRERATNPTATLPR
jgi:hypothetical protein